MGRATEPVAPPSRLLLALELRGIFAGWSTIRSCSTRWLTGLPCEGEWRPFDRSGLRGLLYPDPPRQSAEAASAEVAPQLPHKLRP